MSDTTAERNLENNYLIRNATHFVLPRKQIGQGKHAMVKEAQFFIDQGGLLGTKNRDGIPWGDHWIPVIADGINHARLLAWIIAQDLEHPSSCSFNPPNRLPVGMIREES